VTTKTATPEKRSVPLRSAGWILTALLLAYAALLHNGIGPIPSNLESNWYNPSRFLLDAIMASGRGDAMESVGSAIALLALPALVTAVAVFFTTRSAVARMLSTASVIAAAIFVYYGVQAPGVWSFFHWRWSGCVLLISLCLGVALTAPLLAESWKRQSWPLRLILYLPLFASVVVFERNVTGTDNALAFAISPWPVVQVFGLEVFASVIAVLLVGVALGLWMVSRGLERTPGDLVALSVGAAVLAPAIPTTALWLASQQSLVPFRAGAVLLTVTAAITLVTLVIAARFGIGRSSGRLARRSRIWALGGLLLGLPLLMGQTLTRLDYTATRDDGAQQVIDALQRHYEKESIYPEELTELVDAGELEKVPRPRIGFALLSQQDFRYQSFGTGYILEFSAPRWIQCAYNPPYQEELEDEYEDEYEEDEDLEDLGGAWSCPSKPPELW
jgi:hypothetical protein